MGRELTHVWHSLVASITNSTQGPFMHASWIFVAVMTVSMTTIAIARIVPSPKERRLRRTVRSQLRAAGYEPDE